MSRTLEEPDELWSALLDLRAFLLGDDGTDRTGFLVRGKERWSFTTAARDDAELVVEIDGGAARSVRVRRDAQLPAFLQVYLPIVLDGARARTDGTVHVTGHLAQTLDGRIACLSGDSRWIGNPGDQRHAHRLRALHDAILVGRHTVERDNPLLTVRHVEGRDPRRIVLNGSASTLQRREELNVFTGHGCIVVCDEARTRELQPGADVIGLPADAGGDLAPAQLLAALAARGLHSLLVEGGGKTLSGFFAAGCVDLLHLHVAPIVLGSGVPGFTLPVVKRLEQARRLDAQHFDVEGELLIACRPRRAGAGPAGA
jgi:5-amino-6-(5-phosphoribosylamino)uracil reductase/diaminohydroxyphosphoribosylaminopyrimidine deaminase/5-amino-6-(5-phosphoribosylamino)uracil reductase